MANPLAPPPNSNSPVDTQVPELDPTTGEMAPAGGVQQAPQQQQPNMGFMETIRKAAVDDPSHFYNILAHLAAGATPQEFSNIMQQRTENRMDKASIEQNNAYRQDNLEARREEAESRRLERAQKREEMIQLKRDKELSDTLKWAASSKRVPDAQQQFEEQQQRPTTFEDLDEFKRFKGGLEEVEERRSVANGIVEKYMKQGVALQTILEDKAIMEMIETDPNYEKVIRETHSLTLEDLEAKRLKLRMAKERHTKSMSAMERTAKKALEKDRTGWTEGEKQRESAYQTRYQQAAGIAAAHLKDLNKFDPLTQLTKEGAIPMLSGALVGGAEALKVMEDAWDQWMEYIDTVEAAHAEDEGAATPTPTPTATPAKKSKHPTPGTPEFDALGGDILAKIAAAKYHAKKKEEQ